MLVGERRESPDIGIRNGVPVDSQLAQYCIHVARVPEHDGVILMTRPSAPRLG